MIAVIKLLGVILTRPLSFLIEIKNMIILLWIPTQNFDLYL